MRSRELTVSSGDTGRGLRELVKGGAVELDTKPGAARSCEVTVSEDELVHRQLLPQA